MSKPIQTVEELDAVLHWRRKHAQAMRAVDAGKDREAALQQRLTAADERLDAGISFVTRMIKCAGGQPSIATSYLRDILDKLKPAEGGKPSTCTWTEGEFSWHTGCGKEWQFTDGGMPSENGMEFCHSCGKTLVVEGKGDE